MYQVIKINELSIQRVTIVGTYNTFIIAHFIAWVNSGEIIEISAK